MIMLLAKILVTTSVAFFSIVSAADTWNITVEEFKFGNRSISVPSGDTLQFIFTTVANRSVTGSTLDEPCFPKYRGIESGLLRRPSIYQYKVNGSNPIWIYSRNTSSESRDFCREYRMALAVNPANSNQTETFFDNIPVSNSSCSGVKSPIQKIIAVVALFAGLLAV